MDAPPSVLVVGAGAIGTAFAATVRAAGAQATLADPDLDAREAAPAGIERHLDAIGRAGLPVRDGPPPRVVAAPEGAHDLVLEAGPESREAKAAIFADLVRLPGEAPLATTSSAIPASRIVPESAQARCLVAHPANPPSLIRVIELVPAPGTLPRTLDAAERVLRAIGFDPVRLGAEIPAFVFNRLQSALLREAYRLVDEGVVDVDGLDRLVRDGLGPRWALSGPFETADLNTAGGVRGHAERMGPAYAAIGEARGERGARWSEPLVARVEAERRAILPEEALPARRAWREGALADLLAARARILSAAP